MPTVSGTFPREEGASFFVIGRWVEFYDTRRLHAALQCLPPAEYRAGNPEERINGRKRKLERARKRRG